MNYAVFTEKTLPNRRDYAEFADEADIADYAREAIQAFCKAEIVNGYPNAEGASAGEFKPRNSMTRAEAAAVICRFIEGNIY